MKTKLSVNGPGLEASSVESVSANASVEASIKDITIQQIAGEIHLRSRLESGKLQLSFSPHFEVRIERLEVTSGAPVDRLVKKLVAVGLTEDHAKKAVEVFGDQPFDVEIGDIEGAESKLITEDSHVLVPATNEGRSLDVPLPNIAINLDPVIDVQNLRIENIRVGGSTTLEAKNWATNPSKLSDFTVFTETPDVITYKTAQIDEPGLRPIEVPVLGFPDLATTVAIPRLGASEMPVTVESKTGGFDIRVRLLDWHPRWGVRFCIGIGPFEKCLVIEFGINLTIYLQYRWVLTLLQVALVIRNAFLNNISIALKLTNTVFNKIKIGLFRALGVMIERM